jgi:thiamine phosphate synthase YjbQ (UPF0047 family)
MLCLTHIYIYFQPLLPPFSTASLTINENADPDVRTDMEVALNHIVPEKWAENGESIW